GPVRRRDRAGHRARHPPHTGTDRRHRRAPPPRHHRRGPRRTAPRTGRAGPRSHRDRGQLQRPERRRRHVPGHHPRRGGTPRLGAPARAARLGGRRRRPRTDGHRPGPRHRRRPRARRAHPGRPGPHRTERGVRRPGAGLPARVGHPGHGRTAQPQRLRHLPRPPRRRHRSPHPGHPRAPTAPQRRTLRAGDDVHRRRPGPGRRVRKGRRVMPTFHTDPAEAVTCVRDGAVVMVGGFGAAGQPVELIDALIASGVGDLTIVNNNAGHGDIGLAALIAKGRVRKVICSFPRQHDSWHFDAAYRAGTVALELVPQGTLAERIRAGGAGIGGFFTRTGYGTVLAEGKETRVIDGQGYVLEQPLTADVALIKADTADRAGNLVYRKTARNFGPVMATAAATTVVQVRRVVETGAI